MRLPVLKSFFNDDLFRADDFDFLFPKTNNCLIDLKEGDKELELTAAIPGIDKKDISIEYQDGLLTIKGECSCKKEENKEKYIYKEIQQSCFSRSFKVDESFVDIENIKSNYTNGLLKIILPKKENRKGKTILIE